MATKNNSIEYDLGPSLDPFNWVLAQHGVLYTRRNKGISLSTTLHNNHDDNSFKLDCGDNVGIGLATGLTNITKHNFYD